MARQYFQLAVVSMVLWLCPLVAQSDGPAGMRVHFVDVGQGDATLVELPRGSILVDTGGEKNGSFDSREELNDYLDAFFDRRTDLGGRLDLLILTHPHPDHFRGMKPARWFERLLRPVLETYRPRHIVHNGQNPVANWVKDYLRNQQDAREAIVDLDAIPAASGLTSGVIDPFSSDGDQDPQVRILWGRVDDDTGWCDADFDDENNHSLVVRVDYGDASVLFTGDLESTDPRECEPDDQAGIERAVSRYGQGDLLNVDIYQVGHHGSHNGTTDALVAEMAPLIAVISAGPAIDRGSYTAYDHGHPREKTVGILEDGVKLCRSTKTVQTFDYYKQEVPRSRQMERAVFSTGWDGTVVLFGDETGYWSLERPTGSLRRCEAHE